MRVSQALTNGGDVDFAQELERYLGNPDAATEELLRAMPPEAQREAEEKAAGQFIHEGREAPGWQTDTSDSMGRASSEPSAVRPGTHHLNAGDMAMLAREILMQDLQAHIDATKTAVISEVCLKFAYCQRVKALQSDKEAWGALAMACEWIVESGLGLKVKPLALAVFLVKRGILDRWCDCGNVTSGGPVGE